MKEIITKKYDKSIKLSILNDLNISFSLHIKVTLFQCKAMKMGSKLNHYKRGNSFIHFFLKRLLDSEERTESC